MVARVGYSRAHIDVHPAGGGEVVHHEAASILTRQGGGRIKDQHGRVLREKAGALAATKDPATGLWTLTFVDGEVWTFTVDRASCKACNG